jgi:hypothetical protein
MDDCIEWTKFRDKKGYGRVAHNGEPRFAHRIAYCEHHGLKLADIDGKVVRHRCDNPPCVNPAHLELGTQADNCRDRSVRGRSNSTKLTAAQVLEIRERCKIGVPGLGCRDFARKYGVTEATIRFVMSRATWKHI